MIPKQIHYCWFGGAPKSELITQCIASWKKHLPDYEIVEWNESNFDIESVPYVAQAYKSRKWAFVSDYVRLYALYTQGGIYLDTDVEILRSLDCFLTEKAFTGYETKDSPVTAVMGCEKNVDIIGKLLHYYDNRDFIKPDGTLDVCTNTITITQMLKDEGMVPNGRKCTISELTVYPQIVFCPNNLSRIWNKPSKKSYAIHHFDGSWENNKISAQGLFLRVRRYAVGVLRNTIGTPRVAVLEKMAKGK